MNWSFVAVVSSRWMKNKQTILFTYFPIQFGKFLCTVIVHCTLEIRNKWAPKIPSIFFTALEFLSQKCRFNLKWRFFHFEKKIGQKKAAIIDHFKPRFTITMFFHCLVFKLIFFKSKIYSISNVRKTIQMQIDYYIRLIPNWCSNIFF